MIDFITNIPLATEKGTILVICDKLSKIIHFVATIERTLVKELVRLFKDNIQKLYRLLESIISNREPQFVVELMKKLNRMLEIKMRLLMIFHLQIDRQTEQINQELKQYLIFFTKYIQRDWPKQLVIAKFAVNNKVHLVTTVSLFIANYRREKFKRKLEQH